MAPSDPTNTMADRQCEHRTQEPGLREHASQIDHKVLILSGKGGVGKSTCAVNLAFGLARNGLEVGLLDADLHGPSVPLMTGSAGERAFGAEQGIAPVQVLPNVHMMSMAFFLEDATSPVIWRGPIRANVLRHFVADVEWPRLDCLIVDLPPGTGDEPPDRRPSSARGRWCCDRDDAAGSQP